MEEQYFEIRIYKAVNQNKWQRIKAYNEASAIIQFLKGIMGFGETTRIVLEIQTPKVVVVHATSSNPAFSYEESDEDE